MNMLLTTTAPQWAAQLADRQGHLLQSWPWGEFKSHFGWTPYRIQVDGAAAQVLFRRLPLGFTVAYIPKGPLLDWTDLPRCQQLFSAIHNAAKKKRAVFLKVEPNVGVTMTRLRWLKPRRVISTRPSLAWLILSNPKAPSSSILAVTRRRYWRR
ncbi:MAG TPA: peptidoglycan bridge formation glycyltransferase FemA/FemB family protein [Anaerolineae bacterium]|nr:peptidoglycan bridge formation glycyltransferase FemA/FemB family protein [Anaerolineae bacterium]